MKLIDRLILKASALFHPEDIFVLSNESGEWRLGENKFSSLADAEKYIDDVVEKDDYCTIIINDAGPGIERGEIYDKGTVEIGNTNRCKADPKKSNEYGRQWRDGHKEGEYNHTWV